MEIFCRKTSPGDNRPESYALLNDAVWSHYGISAPEIKKSPSGKPYFPEHPEIFFSISHTNGFVLCALSQRPVGVDIQIKKNLHPAVPNKVCCEDELCFFDFFESWSLKESYIKLLDKKNMPMRDIAFFSRGDKIISGCGQVFGRIYGDIPACSCAAAAFEDDFPKKIQFL